MVYDYKCNNENCNKYDKVIEMEHSMSEVGTKHCECGSKLIRVYSKVVVNLGFDGSYNSTR